MLERADTKALAAQEDPRRFLRATTRIVEQIQARSAGLILAAREAARSDDEIAELTSTIDERRMTIARWLADELRRRQSGRSTAHQTMTTYLLLDPAVYQQLRTTGDSDYAKWLDGALDAILR